MSKYTKEVLDYIRLRVDTGIGTSAIAREVSNKFKVNATFDAIRTKIISLKNNYITEKNRKPIKRLFFDIETSYLVGWFWRTGKTGFINHNQIIEDKKIICISYKWQYEDTVHTLRWTKNQCDKSMIKAFIKILGEADEIIGHNGDRFDIKEIRTRAIKQGLLMFPLYRTLDTLKKARRYFNFNSNRLDYLGQFLEVGRKLDHEGIDLWHKIIRNKCPEALDRMVDYCEQDVILLEDVFNALSPYIDHNTNHAVIQGYDKWQCPNCSSDKVEMHHTDTTAMGWIRRFFKCNVCKKQYKISNKTFINYLTRHIK
jgi:uncharacterized protein YprB with RNaseH-like and TPR domain